MPESPAARGTAASAVINRDVPLVATSPPVPQAAGPHSRSLADYGLVVILSVAVLIWVMQLWNANLLTLPLHYNTDLMLNGMLAFDTSSSSAFIKGTLENPSPLFNPSIGAPEGFNLYDFPVAESLHFLLIRAVSVFSPDWVGAFNFCYLLGFPLAALTAFFVMRHFGVSVPSALASSLLFAFLPYHFLRIMHFFLALYYTIPLAAMVALWVYRDESLFHDLPAGKTRPRLALRRAKPIAALIICVLAASSGIYYAFFAAFFILLAGAAASWLRKGVRPLAGACVLVAVMVLVLFIHLAPSMLYHWREGENPVVGKRDPGEAETIGLRATQLLLPVDGHRLEFLRDLKARYAGPYRNENRAATLGLVGDVGFLMLLVWPFLKSARTNVFGLGSGLSLLTFGGFLLATVGGFGSLFATLVSARIRAYNRISIFIAFFALFAVALALDRLSGRLEARKLRPAAWSVALAVLAFGVWDQTTPSYAPDYAKVRAAFTNDADFVARVETTAAPGSMIFQLPAVPFPEVSVTERMLDYDHFKAYLHSKTLRWSYGAMKNRPAYLWQQVVSSRPPRDFLETLSLAGFAGLWIDRFGCRDTSAMESAFSDVFKSPPIVSADGRYVFYDMGKFNAEVRDRFAASPDETRKDALLHPLLMTWGPGYGEITWEPNATVVWCERRAELRLHNSSSHARSVVLKGNFVACAESGTRSLYLGGELLNARLDISRAARPFRAELSVPPGTHVLRLSTDAQPMSGPRPYAFVVVNLSCE
jgi:phosphoglycerol transferase